MLELLIKKGASSCANLEFWTSTKF
uniref:Uncharacterized protein n=1 Tax=Arundo donax TaxID=35708 RepID=A0A0A8ZJX5_ARUDO